jgi:hypothetical protein
MSMIVVRKKQVNGKPKNKTNKVDISPTALVYRGPLQMPKAKQEDDTWTTQVNIINTIVSSAGGVVATVFTPGSQIQSSSDWVSLAALWNEWRVLSARVELIPWNKYNLPTATVVAPLYTVIDRQSSTALGSLASVANYNSAEAHEPSTKVIRVAKMEDPAEAEWQDTGSAASTSAQFNIKLFSSGNTATTTLYDYFNSYMVQFRGRK